MMRLLLPLLLLAATASAQPDAACRPETHGARAGDGVLDTAALQAALDACHARGGGVVALGPGVYLSGTLHLRSHVELHVGPGAVLRGSRRMADYEPERPHLLYARGVTDVAITGTGTIDGSGDAFWGDDWEPDERPYKWLIFYEAERVTVRDVRLIDSPSHTLSFDGCRWVLVDGIHIVNPMRSANTDGISLRATSDARIAGVYIETGDDAVVLKSEGPVENVVVTGSILISDDAAFKLGTGSETAIRNVVFASSVVRESRYGIALFMKGGGVYEDLHFSDLLIQTASRHKTEYPIYIDLDRLTPQTDLGHVRDVSFSDVRMRTRGSVLVAGHPERPLERIRFDNVELVVAAAVDNAPMRKPKGNRRHVWHPSSADLAPTNAHFVLGHARQVELDGVTIRETESGHPRAGLHAQAVDGLYLDGATLSGSTGKPALDLIGGSGAALVRSRLPGGAQSVRADSTYSGPLLVDGQAVAPRR